MAKRRAPSRPQAAQSPSARHGGIAGREEGCRVGRRRGALAAVVGDSLFALGGLAKLPWLLWVEGCCGEYLLAALSTS